MAEPKPIGAILDKTSDSLVKKSKPGPGGPRPGSGRPKGKMTAKKLVEMKVKENFNQLTLRAATKLWNSQFARALGEQHLFVKYHTGEGKNRKTVVDMITDPEIIKEYVIDDGLTLNQQGDDEYYYISTKPADNQAIEAMLNRAMGKAPDKIEVSGGFFNQSKLVIEVIGERQDAIIEGELAAADAAEAETSAEPEAGPSTPAPEEPASS